MNEEDLVNGFFFATQIISVTKDCSLPAILKFLAEIASGDSTVLETATEASRGFNTNEQQSIVHDAFSGERRKSLVAKHREWAKVLLKSHGIVL